MANEELVGLASRCNYPVKISYDKTEFMLAPKAKTKKEFVKSKLGDLNPKEVVIVR